MTNSLDAEAIESAVKQSAGEWLQDLEVFAEIDSTNSYLMQATAPAPGKALVAIANRQTAGRGRHGKAWESPPGSGVMLSIAYSFLPSPANLSALTLALGLAAIDALEAFGADGVQLKWPNDLVAADGKLGGILTEVRQQSNQGATVVAGIGVNIDFEREPDGDSGWTAKSANLKQLLPELPKNETIIAQLVEYLLKGFIAFDEFGFEPLAERWSRYDWLLGRELTVGGAAGPVMGIGAGIGTDGALLVESGANGTQRITSGSITHAGERLS